VVHLFNLPLKPFPLEQESHFFNESDGMIRIDSLHTKVRVSADRKDARLVDFNPLPNSPIHAIMLPVEDMVDTLRDSPKGVVVAAVTYPGSNLTKIEFQGSLPPAFALLDESHCLRNVQEIQVGQPLPIPVKQDSLPTLQQSIKQFHAYCILSTVGTRVRFDPTDLPGDQWDQWRITHDLPEAPLYATIVRVQVNPLSFTVRTHGGGVVNLADFHRTAASLVPGTDASTAHIFSNIAIEESKREFHALNSFFPQSIRGFITEMNLPLLHQWFRAHCPILPHLLLGMPEPSYPAEHLSHYVSFLLLVFCEQGHSTKSCLCV